jgi:2'-5' RNA ligase
LPTAVVCAAFDTATDEVIETWRARADAAGLPVRRTHRPHFTLSAARIPGAELADVCALAGEVAARHGPGPLTMTRLGSFPSGALWLGPDESPPLAELQRDVQDTLARRWPPAFGAQSDPDGWVAHCTLATRVWRGRMTRFTRQALIPFPATVDALAVILVGGRGDVAHLRLLGVAPPA